MQTLHMIILSFVIHILHEFENHEGMKYGANLSPLKNDQLLLKQLYKVNMLKINNGIPTKQWTYQHVKTKESGICPKHVLRSYS